MNPELQDSHPGEPELVAQAMHRRCNHTEVFGDDRERPQLGLGSLEELEPGRATPPAVPGGLLARLDRPGGHESPEVVDPREVEELEGATEALDPPAVALGPVGGPAVERVDPELAVRVEGVRGCARLDGEVEELPVEEDVGRRRRDIDRQIAQDAHTPVGGVAAESAPLPFEANLVGQGAIAREPLPVAGPVAVPLAKARELGIAHLGLRVGEQGR